MTTDSGGTDGGGPNQAMRRRAWERYNAGALEEAQDLFEQILQRDPDDGQAWAGRGMTRAGLEDFAGAVEDYSRSVDLQPEFSLGYYHRGEAFRAMFEIEQAIGDYSRSIEIAPRDVTYHARGLARTAIQMFDLAREDFTQAIELNPDKADAYLARAQVHAMEEQFAEARADYDRAAELNLGSADLYTGRGMVALREGGPDGLAGAIADFREAVRIDKDAWRPRSMLALALAMNGEPDEAMSTWQEAQQRTDDPDDREELEGIRQALLQIREGA